MVCAIRVGSLFSGIGGLDLGLERAGMEVMWQVEIDPFRRGLLARRWLDVERFEDVRRVRGHAAKPSQAREQQLGAVDLICGGFPCQDLSVAGRRAGLQGARSGLFFEFARILGELRPRWCLIENVPGLLSSNGGDDFRVVIDSLQGIGYGASWRVLDSRHFGVPQRRRRVYIVGSLGDLRSAAVLFEPAGGGGDTATGREEGERVAFGSARGVARSLQRVGGGDDYGANKGTVIHDPDTAHALSAKRSRSGRYDPNGESYVVGAPADADGVREAAGVPRRVDPQLPLAVRESHPGEISTDDAIWALGGDTGQGRGTLGVLAAPLEAADGHHGRSSPRGDGADNLVASPLRSRSASEGVNPPGRGGEDDENLTTAGEPMNAKPCCPDGPRYAALGDAVTVNVAEWIGRRIVMVEA